jgi:hypothetical protein
MHKLINKVTPRVPRWALAAAAAAIVGSAFTALPAGAGSVPARSALPAPSVAGPGWTAGVGVGMSSARGQLAAGVRDAARMQGSGRSGRGDGFVRDARGFATIDVPGASVTAAVASNRGGQVVGAYLDARNRTHGFLREARRLRRIDFPGAEGTFVSGIDDRGRVSARTPRTPVRPPNAANTDSC